MQSITSSSGQHILVDNDDFEWASKHAICVNPVTNYATFKSGNKRIYLHRAILKAPYGSIVDHINRNTLDNRKENLRLVSPQENAFNRRRRSDNTSSQYKGVSLNKKSGKWHVRLKLNGQFILSKYCQTEIEAALLYNEHASRIFKEHACLNVVS